jgi:hypothetical protein
MTIEEILAAIVSAAIAYAVPKILGKAREDLIPNPTTPWFGWCLAGLFGGAIGGIASALLGFIDMGFEGFGNWAVYGAALGMTQWFVLRGYHPVNAWYPLGSTLGWMTFNFGGPLGGWFVAAIVVGVLQFFSLRNLKESGWWIPANFIAWPIAGAIGFVVGTLLTPTDFSLAWVIGWGTVGLVGNTILVVPLAKLRK